MAGHLGLETASRCSVSNEQRGRRDALADAGESGLGETGVSGGREEGGRLGFGGEGQNSDRGQALLSCERW